MPARARRLILRVMNERLHGRGRWKRSLSRGAAWTKALLGVVVLVVLVLAAMKLFPSREERLRKFLEAEQAAFAEGREEDFAAGLDPSVVYQKKRGLADIRRDFKRYHETGLPAPKIVKSEPPTFDDEGADLTLDVVVSVDMRAVAQIKVRIRAVDSSGVWRATSIAWE